MSTCYKTLPDRNDPNLLINNHEGLAKGVEFLLVFYEKCFTREKIQARNHGGYKEPGAHGEPEKKKIKTPLKLSNEPMFIKNFFEVVKRSHLDISTFFPRKTIHGVVEYIFRIYLTMLHKPLRNKERRITNRDMYMLFDLLTLKTESDHIKEKLYGKFSEIPKPHMDILIKLITEMLCIIIAFIPRTGSDSQYLFKREPGEFIRTKGVSRYSSCITSNDGHKYWRAESLDIKSDNRIFSSTFLAVENSKKFINRINEDLPERLRISSYFQIYSMIAFTWMKSCVVVSMDRGENRGKMGLYNNKTKAVIIMKDPYESRIRRLSIVHRESMFAYYPQLINDFKKKQDIETSKEVAAINSENPPLTTTTKSSKKRSSEWVTEVSHGGTTIKIRKSNSISSTYVGEPSGKDEMIDPVESPPVPKKRKIVSPQPVSAVQISGVSPETILASMKYSPGTKKHGDTKLDEALGRNLKKVKWRHDAIYQEKVRVIKECSIRRIGERVDEITKQTLAKCKKAAEERDANITEDSEKVKRAHATIVDLTEGVCR